MLSIERETPDQPDIGRFFQKADERSSLLYPAESRHGPGLAALMAPNVRFYVARVDGHAVGCGGYVLGPERSAELKRIFVNPDARGRGIGQNILAVIEGAASGEGVRQMQLETGVKSFEAIRLYTRLGYRERGPFGAYAFDPLSVFMEKQLGHGMSGHAAACS